MTFKLIKSPSHLAFILLTLLSLSSCLDAKKENSASLKWMFETTGIQIPDSIQNQVFYDNHEWGLITKFQMSKNTFDKFCKSYHMTPLNDQDTGMQLLNDIEGIPLDEQFIETPSDYFIFSDCKTGNSWTLLAHQKSSTIWFEVLFADFGGDIAPCERDTVTYNAYIN